MYLLRHTQRKTKHLTSLTRKKNGMNVSYKKYHRDITKSVYLCLFLKFKCTGRVPIGTWKRGTFLQNFILNVQKIKNTKKKLVDIYSNHMRLRVWKTGFALTTTCMFFVFVYLRKEKKFCLNLDKGWHE